MARTHRITPPVRKVPSGLPDPLPWKRRDRDGARLKIGDVVRVVGVPPLPGPRWKETRAVFRHAVGLYKEILAFDEIGHAELYVRILKGPNRGMHTVWIEPFLLKLRNARS